MTYSIVARCPDTGVLGVATLTHNLAVGSVVPWIRAGVGAIATQADAQGAYGHKGLELLHKGRSPADVLKEISDLDNLKEIRQVGILGGDGQTAARTGNSCIPFASHVAVKNASFQANIMRSPGVPEAMAESWHNSTGKPLEVRLLDALTAAEQTGGDLRGRQSAALKLAGATVSEPWENIIMDLRVDDHTAPLTELTRLVSVAAAYRLGNEAEAHELDGDLPLATSTWQRAADASPNNPDIACWHGIFLLKSGKLDDAEASLKKACSLNPDLKELLARMVRGGRLDPVALTLI